ncbi:hypothetical protein Tcan_04843 [Toxocara canis]|uniref:HTH OST-type domain-containing protein n=1 Tax=Toxocara canis TaxID=6265 RepID=A0A0B2VLK8_TOXCA|nr:hypothetical protein Tcan_04843 [Toxocara canis]
MDDFSSFSNFVGSLVGAVRGGCLTEDVARRYREMLGTDIKFVNMGYKTLEDLLKACEKEGKICRMSGRWFVKATKDNKHVVDLVNSTKPTVTKGKGKSTKYRGRLTYTTFSSKQVNLLGTKASTDCGNKEAGASSSNVYNATFAETSKIPSIAAPAAADKLRLIPPPPGFEDKVVEDGQAMCSSKPAVESKSYLARRDNGYTKHHKCLKAAVESCGGEASWDHLRVAFEKRSGKPLDENAFRQMFGVDLSDVKEIRRVLDGTLEVKVEDGQLIFSTPADDFADVSEEGLDYPVAVQSCFEPQREVPAVKDGFSTVVPAAAAPPHEPSRPWEMPYCRGPKNKQSELDMRSVGESHPRNPEPAGEQFGVRRDVRCINQSQRSACSDAELSLLSLGRKILEEVSRNGPFEIERLGAFLQSEHGVLVYPADYGERNWDGVVERILSMERHPSFVVHKTKIGLREDFLAATESRSATFAAKEDEEFLAASLTYRILKSNDGRMEHRAVFDELLKWKITCDHILFCSLVVKYFDIFECEFTQNGHFLYLAEGAVAPSCSGAMPNSSLLAPIVTTDVLSNYNCESPPFEKVDLAELEVVPYRSGTFRFKVGFFPFGIAADDMKKFHAQLYNFYKAHWQDESLAVKQLTVGDHVVMYDLTGDYVRRASYMGMEKDGQLKVWLIDDLKYKLTSTQRIRKLTEHFALTPAFGVVAYTRPFRVLGRSTMEFSRAVNAVRRAFMQAADTGAQVDIRIYSNRAKRVRRVIQLRNESTTQLCLPDCLVDKNFIEFAEQQCNIPHAEQGEQDSDDAMWGSDNSNDKCNYLKRMQHVISKFPMDILLE